MRKIWFRSQSERDREEYEAQVAYFCDYLFDTLDNLTDQQWEYVLVEIAERLYKILEDLDTN